MLEHYENLRGQSDALSDELAIGEMVRAIAPLRSYDIRGLRLLAYRQAEIPQQHVEKFDTAAAMVEKIRRRAMGYVFERSAA